MKKTLLVMLLVFACIASVFANAEPETTAAAKELTTVRVAIHGNEGGASLFAIAQQQGIFEKHGIKPEYTVVAGGVPEMAAMRADDRTLDIGFIGAGVAWNPIDPTGNQLSFVFLDCLSNAENLIAKKGIFKDSNGNGKYDLDEIYAGLKGQTVYMETGTTAGTWFIQLIDTINKGRSSSEQLWIFCEDAAFTAGITPANNNTANRVQVVNYSNSNIPAGMATKDASAVQIAAAYAPAPATAINNSNGTIELICDNSALDAKYVSPSTWVASNKWLEENPAVAQAFIDALLEAAQYRYDHMDEAMSAADVISNLPAGSCVADCMIVFNFDDYKTLFASKDAKGYAYIQALYDQKVGNVIANGSTPKTFEQAFNDSFITTAIKNYK